MSTRPTATRWVRAPDVLWRRLPDGVLVLTPTLDTALAVRGSAAAIFDLLEAPATPDRLVSELASAYPGAVPPDEMRAAVEQVLDTLVDVGAVQGADPAGPST